jgi:hypothetical protein
MQALAGISRAEMVGAIALGGCLVLAETPIGTGDGKPPTTGAFGVKQKGNLS